MEKAIEVLDQGLLELKPVKLSASARLTLAPGQSCELRGCLSRTTDTPVDVLPRSQDWLPPHVEVSEAEMVTDTQVKVTVKNVSKQQTVTLTSKNVLAELQVNTASSESQIGLEALVGPCCEAKVKVNGTGATALVDSGSQVTIISETFYKKYLTSVPLEQPSIDLVINGAGGHKVPYLGCVRVSMELPEDIAGTREIIDTIAVVSPDTPFSTRVPIIVGTNTIRRLASAYQLLSGDKEQRTRLRCEMVFACNEAIGNKDGRLASVRLVGKAVTIPAQSVMDLKGSTDLDQLATRDAVLIQEPIVDALPDGLAVLASKVSTDTLSRMRVTVVNSSDVPIKLKKKQVIADVCMIRAEYAVTHILQQMKEDCNPQGKETFERAQTETEKTDNHDVLRSKLKFDENVDPVWKASFTDKLLMYSDVFAMSEFDIGKTDVTHDIELMQGPQIRARPRPIPPQDLEDVRHHIQELLDANIIKPSSSPFASPIVLVRKKTGQLRLCIDYRAVNARTIRDSYTVPKIEDLLRTLTGAQYFSSMDLSKAYYQVPLTERAKKISAFITPLGLYEFERLSFGMVNAPSTFQRLMEKCFQDMNLSELIVFLDDVLVHGKTLEDMEERTLKVLQRLRKYQLKLDPEKCTFGVREVRHLGFLISADGVKPDPEKVEALTTWPVPKTVREVKSFLGFCGFYRRWVEGFAGIVKPLNDLTTGYLPTKTAKKTGKKPQLTLSSDISHLWGDRHQLAYEAIITALTSAPILGFPDPQRPYQLHCDASGTGLGAVLYQKQETGPKVIAYASRGLNKSESNYPAHKREFLALKWAMSEKFHDYLLGSKVTVYTDNNPLCYVLKSAKLDATSHRWLASLALYDFDLVYKKGSTHTDADGLSRRPQPPPEDDREYLDTIDKTGFLLEKARRMEGDLQPEVTREAVAAILQAKGVRTKVHCMGMYTSENEDVDHIDTVEPHIPAVEIVGKDLSAIPDSVLEPVEPLLNITPPDWVKIQQSDPNLAMVKKSLQTGQAIPLTNAVLKAYQRERKHLILKDGVLYREIKCERGGNRTQILIPQSHQDTAMRGVHDDLFHTHFEDAIQHARARFYWPFMASHIQSRIKQCERCIRRKPTDQKAPLGTIVTNSPMELLSIDFLTIEVKGQKQNILVVMDHFTKFAQAICTKDQTARTVAKVLWENIFMIYGFPARILSDQGRDFESRIVKELCGMLNIEKCRTTPYHPAGNPVERWNRTLIGMLRSLEDEKKKDWRKHLQACVHAYNCCVHQSTGYSPFYLFFGRQPRLPIDLAFGISLDRKTSCMTEYVKTLKMNLKQAYDMASDSMKRVADRNKVRYDLRAHANSLEPGDRCLVRKLGPKITSKVDDRWERDVYVVISRHNELPVYTVRQEVGKGPDRTLHRNLLLPVGAIGVCEQSADKQTSREKRKETITPMPEEESDEEDIFIPSYSEPQSRLIPRPEADPVVPKASISDDKVSQEPKEVLPSQAEPAELTDSDDPEAEVSGRPLGSTPGDQDRLYEGGSPVRDAGKDDMELTPPDPEAEVSGRPSGSTPGDQDRLYEGGSPVRDAGEDDMELAPPDSEVELVLPRRTGRIRKPVIRYGDYDLRQADAMTLAWESIKTLERVTEDKLEDKKAGAARQVLAVLQAILGGA